MAKYSYTYRGSKGAQYEVEADSADQAKAQAEAYFASQNQTLRASDNGKPKSVKLGSTGSFDPNAGEIYWVQDQGYFQNVDGGTLQLTDNVNTYNVKPGLFDELQAQEKAGTLNVQHAPTGTALDAKLKGNDPIVQNDNKLYQNGQQIEDLDANRLANDTSIKSSSSSKIPKYVAPAKYSDDTYAQTAKALGYSSIDEASRVLKVPADDLVKNVNPNANLNTQSSASAPRVSAPTVALAPGSTDTNSVKQLQDFLVSQGYMTQAQVNTGYGTYGPQTTAAVKKWQEDHGVDNSTGPGYWGPRTIAAYTSSGPSTPAQTNIKDPIDVSGGGSLASGGAISLPKASGAQTAATYTTSLTTQIATLKDQIQKQADKQSAEYAKKINDLEQKERELEQLQTEGLADIKDATFRETAEKRAAYDLEKQRFDENYNANQALIGELDTLLTQGNTLITQMQETTGLASIMSPRISKTMTDVAARAGVIEAVLNARNGQMANAQNQLQTSLGAITSIYQDEIDYYTAAINFYGGLKGETTDKIKGLAADQKEYADVKLNLLSNELSQVQETAKLIQTALLDPDTALIYGAAGVTLKDSVETINQKLATYQYSQEVVDINNKMSSAGYSKSPIAGVQPIQIMDSSGKVTNWYKAGSSGDDFTLGTNQVRFSANGDVIARGPGSADSGGSGGSGSTATQIEQAKQFIKDNPNATRAELSVALRANTKLTDGDINAVLDAAKVNEEKASIAGNETTIAIALVKSLGDVAKAKAYLESGGTIEVNGTKVQLSQRQIDAVEAEMDAQYPTGKRSFWQSILPGGK